MLARSRRFASRLSEFEDLCSSDREEVRMVELCSCLRQIVIFQILAHNLVHMVKLATCSMFSLDMPWTSQLSPILGAREVQKLDFKLKSLNVTGLDNLCLNIGMFFTAQHQQEQYFGDLVLRVGSWAKVAIFLCLRSFNLFFVG